MDNGVSSEMYAIPWFVTYMATKFNNHLLLIEFWDRVVNRDEPSFMFFFLVSFII
jgi:hypothetical protein